MGGQRGLADVRSLALYFFYGFPYLMMNMIGVAGGPEHLLNC